MTCAATVSSIAVRMAEKIWAASDASSPSPPSMSSTSKLTVAPSVGSTSAITAPRFERAFVVCRLCRLVGDAKAHCSAPKMVKMVKRKDMVKRRKERRFQ